MPAFDSTTPTSVHEFQALNIRVPYLFAEGHILSAPEALQLNRFVAIRGDDVSAVIKFGRRAAVGVDEYLFASGMRMTEIADHLSLSVKTVSTYRSRLLDKLNLNSNAQLMRYAFQQGMVS